MPSKIAWTVSGFYFLNPYCLTSLQVYNQLDAILGSIFTLLLKLHYIKTNQPVSQSQRNIDSLARLLLKVAVGIGNSIY
jgi:hypothetical protein